MCDTMHCVENMLLICTYELYKYDILHVLISYRRK